LKLRKNLIEKLKKKNQELIKLNQELIRLDQEKNEFLEIATHDLKNPLSVIKGLAEHIEEIIEYDEISSKEVIKEITSDISMIHNSAQQMFNIITNLLEVDMIETGGMKLSLDNIDILPILKNLVAHYQELAKEKQITLNLTVTKGSDYTAFVDANLVHQILDNLISNAIKYSPHGKNVFIRLLQTTNVIRSEVRDEGPGLNETDQKQLFSKFTRLTARPTGGEHSTGLGLFIVKKLVQILHGKVWCETQLGQGATFIVELPMN
jgi:two-component system sensor histidine kinase/response regulator